MSPWWLIPLGAVYLGLVLALWRHIYFRMDSHLVPRPRTDAPAVESARDTAFHTGAARAGDITFNPAPAPQPRALSDFFGEQLVFESICGARNLHSVFTAYAMADAAQRRDFTRDERMFYDACLGATLRGIIDEHRARSPEPVTHPEATPASIVNTSHH